MISFAPDDSSVSSSLYPFAQITAACELRAGILTISEKWVRLLQKIKPDLTLSSVPGPLIPDARLIQSISENGYSEELVKNWLSTGGRQLTHPWQLFQWNDSLIREDFNLITENRISAPVPSSVQTIAPENIFIEPGARLQHCLLNASTGPVYIGKDTEIMEGALIRGPFALCEGAVVKMGAKVYGATTIGPYSVVAGEIKNAVLMGYSNKGHDGYLGDAVLGEWCNLGAGTSNSNIKNTAGEVTVWNRAAHAFVSIGQKCGLLMGDFSRAAINTSFNTGTVVGVCCNVFGEGLTPKLIPDFSWGASGESRYKWEKAIEDIRNWKKLKNKTLTEKEIQQLKSIFDRN